MVKEQISKELYDFYFSKIAVIALSCTKQPLADTEVH